MGYIKIVGLHYSKEGMKISHGIYSGECFRSGLVVEEKNIRIYNFPASQVEYQMQERNEKMEEGHSLRANSYGPALVVHANRCQRRHGMKDKLYLI